MLRLIGCLLCMCVGIATPLVYAIEESPEPTGRLVEIITYDWDKNGRSDSIARFSDGTVWVKFRLPTPEGHYWVKLVDDPSVEQIDLGEFDGQSGADLRGTKLGADGRPKEKIIAHEGDGVIDFGAITRPATILPSNSNLQFDYDATHGRFVIQLPQPVQWYIDNNIKIMVEAWYMQSVGTTGNEVKTRVVWQRFARALITEEDAQHTTDGKERWICHVGTRQCSISKTYGSVRGAGSWWVSIAGTNDWSIEFPLYIFNPN